MLNFLTKIFGDPNKKEISRLQKIVEKLTKSKSICKNCPTKKLPRKPTNLKNESRTAKI
jgi:Preprotein translocase subunit SecA (ATPase, RNA helicase)